MVLPLTEIDLSNGVYVEIIIFKTINRGFEMYKSDWLLGHKPIDRRLNVKKELKRLSRDPLEPLLQAMGKIPDFVILQDEFSRYREMYYFYYLSLDRFLHENSIAVRWMNGTYDVRKQGGKYTSAQRKLADNYCMINRFLEVDFFNCILYARMLLDRTIALSRYFLEGDNLPSFTSFNDHKRFFQRQKLSYGEYEDYAAYIREQTDWFEMPLKITRDKFLVHAGKQHIKNFGYTNKNELSLIIDIPSANFPNEPSENVIIVSIPQLAQDMETFLIWFSDFGLRVFKNKKDKKNQNSI